MAKLIQLTKYNPRSKKDKTIWLNADNICSIEEPLNIDATVIKMTDGTDILVKEKSKDIYWKSLH